MPPLATLLLYILAGTTVGLLALSGIPAAPLAGALLGAGLLSMSQSWNRPLLAIGNPHRSGNRDRHRDRHRPQSTSLDQLQTLWKPALLITLSPV